MGGEKFKPYGDYAVQITRHILQKATDAVDAGLTANDGDFSYTTFRRECDSLCKAIANDHPGGQSDKFRLVRSNFNTQLKRFKTYLTKGSGYPKHFLETTGLIDSELGGSSGNIIPGDDPDAEEKEASEAEVVDDDSSEDIEEVPLADKAKESAPEPTPKKPAAKKTPKKTTPRKPSVVQFNGAASCLNLADDFDPIDNDEMQIITVVQNNVEVSSFAPVRWQDLLVVQALLPGCAVLSTLTVEVNRDNPNEGKLSVDLDPYLSLGDKRTNKRWREGNVKLAGLLEALFSIELKKSAVEGSTPHHGRVTEKFNFPDDLPAQLNPVDPFVLGFRGNKPTPIGTTLFETKMVKTKNKAGKVVPGYLVTAFFFVEKFTHVNDDAARGLRVDTAASDSDSVSSTPRADGTPRNKKRKTKGTVVENMPGDGGGAEEMKVEASMV